LELLAGRLRLGHARTLLASDLNGDGRILPQGALVLAAEGNPAGSSEGAQ
jgi:hypothetical protein